MMLMLSRFGLTRGRQPRPTGAAARHQGLPTAHSWVEEMRRLRASEKTLIALSLTNIPIEVRLRGLRKGASLATLSIHRNKTGDSGDGG